jgi:hypothetical protein
MSWLMSLLGVVGGFGLARALDAAWVTYWYAGNRALGFPEQVAVDAAGMAAAGWIAGALGLWLAGSSARGIGFWIGLLLLGSTAVDFALGIANAPVWHEVVTALVMVPTAMIGGGARLPRSHRRVPAP